MARALLALLLAAALSGCREDASTSCREVGEAFAALVLAELEQEGDLKALEEARAELPAAEARLAETCRTDAWNKASRTCVIQAQNPEELEACRLVREGDEDHDGGATGG